MRAWLIDDLKSGVSQLRLATVMDPAPETGQVILRVDYAALNPADRYLSEGQYPARPALPHILGRDAVGSVEAVGPGVQGFQTGQRALLLRSEVGVTIPGTFAERVAVPAESLAALPGGWDDEQAAGAPLVYMTAYQALTCWGPLPQGSTVLVTGGSGGVGVATTQLARALGYSVVALSRSAEKRNHLERLGADHTLDPTQSDWPKTLRQLLGNRRVDLAVDNIGGNGFKAVIEALGEHGRVSCVGQLAGPIEQFSTATLFFRRLRVGGVAVGAYTAAESQDAWKNVLQLMARTGARPLVDAVFPFSALPEAFEKLKAGPMGKVILQVKA